MTDLELHRVGVLADMRPALATAKLPVLERLVVGLGKKPPRCARR